MSYKVGQVLYNVGSEEDDNGKPTKFSLQEWIIRSIRKGRVYASLKETGVTWVKQSTKHHDWGWASYIPTYLKRDWRETTEPFGLATTKLGAWKLERAAVIKWVEKEYQEAALKTVDRMISQYSKKKKK